MSLTDFDPALVNAVKEAAPSMGMILYISGNMWVDGA